MFRVTFDGSITDHRGYTTIGGGVGNNSCGAHSIVYGKTIDNVLGLNYRSEPDEWMRDPSPEAGEFVDRRGPSRIPPGRAAPCPASRSARSGLTSWTTAPRRRRRRRRRR